MNAPLDGFQQEAPSFETLGSFLKRERELRASLARRAFVDDANLP